MQVKDTYAKTSYEKNKFIATLDLIQMVEVFAFLCRVLMGWQDHNERDGSHGEH